MPENTPRGYTYPVYGDAQDFPAQLEEFAEDVDLDVQSQVDNLADHLDQPAARVSGSDTVAIAANTDVTLSWPTEEFDPTGRFNPGTPTIITLNAGIWIVSASCHWSGNANSTESACGLRINSTVGGVQARSEVRRALNSTPDTLLTETWVETLMEVAVSADVSIIARHNLPVSNNITFREFTVTKVAE